MPLVGQMPAAALTEQQQQLDTRGQGNTSSHNFGTKAREAFQDAAAAVKHTFQNATEPITHAQAKKAEKDAAAIQKQHECEENCLHQQHDYALRCPSAHDKTKIHCMMEAKHNDFFVPFPGEKVQRQEVKAPSLDLPVLESVKEVFKGKSQDHVTKDALLQQHRAALNSPSACDKTKFEFI